MSTETTLIHCSIDLEAPGRRVGWLEVRHSNNRHAYGIILASHGLLLRDSRR